MSCCTVYYPAPKVLSSDCFHVLMCVMHPSTKPRGRLPCAESFVQRLLSCTHVCHVCHVLTAHVHAHVLHLGLRSREVDYPAPKVLSSDCFHVLMSAMSVMYSLLMFMLMCVTPVYGAEVLMSAMSVMYSLHMFMLMCVTPVYGAERSTAPRQGHLPCAKSRAPFLCFFFFFFFCAVLVSVSSFFVRHHRHTSWTNFRRGAAPRQGYLPCAKSRAPFLCFLFFFLCAVLVSASSSSALYLSCFLPRRMLNKQEGVSFRPSNSHCAATKVSRQD